MPGAKEKSPTHASRVPDDTHVSGQANQPLSRPAHALAPADVVRELESNSNIGLSPEVAQARLAEYGPNVLGETESVSVGRILLTQVANAMTMVLILAMAISYGIKSYIEGGVITAVILLNVIVGFIQEYSAAKTMDSLKSLSAPSATVVRNGEAVVMPSSDLVPGDVVELKMGDTVPADVRLTRAKNFETDEALLTGESVPVRKSPDAVFEDATGPGDRLNVAYSSSNVTKGRAWGVVFATGAFTEIGAIAAALREKRSRLRPVPRRTDGRRARPHRYAWAGLLSTGDAIGRFLGLTVGTPLQRKMSMLAMRLFGIAIVCFIVVLAANRFDGRQEVIIYGVATGLSMIPASLVVVLTITMAASTKRMAQRHVVVRNLRSIEALGAVTDICSDKTGTLTQGQMVARGAWVPGCGTYFVEPASNPADAAVRFDARAPADINFEKLHSDPGVGIAPAQLLRDSVSRLQDFLAAASLANLATVTDEAGEWKTRGDPTEIAIQVFAHRFGWNRLVLTAATEAGGAWTELAELPFDSDVKRMSVIMRHNATGENWVFTKGAVERVLSACTHYCPRDVDEGNAAVPISDEFHQLVLKNMETLAGMGLRVLALASRKMQDDDKPIAPGDEVDRAAVETQLAFRGLIGLYDPPRPESAPAVKRCHRAGITVHMLTGDHPETAKAIAQEVGILPSRMDLLRADVAEACIMTATQFDALTDGQIDALPVLPLVIARCAPSTKVRMIDALHRRERFCAMTGDGVNDSPSLRRADVGIAMGQAGSDVAKDASDIVLSDDNFASIVAAIEEGRRSFDNIQKFVLHVLAENIAQAGTLLIGLAFKDPNHLSVFPLAPVQIIWIIMVTSGMPDMGLGFEPAVSDILERPPQSLRTGIFTKEFLIDMVVYGLWITALCLGAFSFVIFHNGGGESNIGRGCNESYSEGCETVFRARATTFACLTWFALFLAWEMMDMRRSFFRMNPIVDGRRTNPVAQWARDIWRNQFLFWSIMAGFLTLFPTLYIPGLNHVVFKHSGISWEWGVVFIAATIFFAGVEAWKWCKRAIFRRRRDARAPGMRAAASSLDVERTAFADYLDAQTYSTMESWETRATTCE